MACLERGYQVRPVGTPRGPCGEECSSVACQSARTLADATCFVCKQPLGFGASIIFHPIGPMTPRGRIRGDLLVARHEPCVPPAGSVPK